MKKTYLIAVFSLLTLFKLIAQPIGWTYSLPILLTENSGSLVTNYQARLTVNTQTLIAATQMDVNGADIRFGKDCAGSTLYNYWIESGINTPTTVIWVKVDTLFANTTRTFFMFYGNSIATTVSAVPGTFNGPMSSTDSVASGGAGGATTSQRGFRFSPNEDLLVTDFGKREPNGSQRYVTLFNFATQAIVAQTQVSGPAAQYSYGALTSPIWLTQGTQYVLELYQGASDGYYFGTSSQIGQHLTYLDMRYCNSCTQNTFPTNVLSNYHYGYPDLWYFTKNNVSPAPTYTLGSPGGALTSNVGPNVAYCIGGSATIGGIATGGTGVYTYSWSPTTDLSSTTTATVVANPSVTTVYTLTVIDGCGSVATASVSVTVNQLPVIAVAAINDSMCLGGNMNLMVTGSSSSYLWMPGSSTNPVYNVSPTSNQTYTVTGTDVNGCVSVDSISVIVAPLPIVTVTGSYSSVCDNLITPLVMTASGAVTYTWNPGSGTGTTFTDTPSANTTYTVVGTDALGCSNSANYSVTLLPSPVATAIGDTVCSGSCATLVGTATGGTPGYVYLWTPLNTTTATTTACPTINSCYTLTVVDVNGCLSTALACVQLNPAPMVVAAGQNAMCVGDSAMLNATGSNIASINWSPASSVSPSTGMTVVATPTVTTTYTIVATSPAGCQDSTTLTLIVNQLPTVTYASSWNSACLNDAAITLTGGLPSGGTYSGTGVSAGVFTPMTAGNGTHVITYSYNDVNGCSASATQTVNVSACTGIQESHSVDGVSVFPNPFSSVLTIHRNSSDEVTVNIFDAEGRLVITKKTVGSKIEIETSELPNGIYSVQLIDANGIKVIRVAKNN